MNCATPKILIFMGETASGKTRRAIAVAQHFGAEIINADSRQIYRGMEIGTTAPSPAERAAVPHHLVAFLDPSERYSAAQFMRDVIRCIGAITGRGKRVIIVGGTGFYIRSLCGEMMLGTTGSSLVRERLTREAQLHDGEFLYAWLTLLDPKRAAKIQAGDRYRTLRALEIALTRQAEMQTDAQNIGHASAATSALPPTLPGSGLVWQKLWLQTDAVTLHARIDARTTYLIEAGLLDEAAAIGSHAVAASAVGYPTALAYLAGQSTRAELHAQLSRATRQYAKRQRTWLRAEPGVLTAPGTLSDGELFALVHSHCLW